MLTPAGRLKKLEAVHRDSPSKLASVVIDQVSSSKLTGYLRVVGRMNGERLSAIVLLRRGNPVATEVRIGEEISKGMRGLDVLRSFTITSGVVEVYELTDEEVERALRLNPENLMEAAETPSQELVPLTEQAVEEIPSVEGEVSAKPSPPVLEEAETRSSVEVAEASFPSETAIDLPSDLPLVEEVAQTSEWPESLEELKLEEAPREEDKALDLPPEEIIEDEEAAIVAQLKKITLPKKEDVRKILEREGFQT